MSFKARGMLAFLLSHTDTWEVYAGWVEQNGQEGRESVQAGFRELEQFGYITFEELPRIEGKFTRGIWLIHEEAVPVNKITNRTNTYFYFIMLHVLKNIIDIESFKM